jgi:MipA family protein
MTYRMIRVLVLAALLVTLDAPFVMAAINGKPVPAQAQPATPVGQDWIITIGGTVEYGPLFSGSRKFGPSGMPSFDIRRASEPDEFSAPDDGLDYTLFSTKTFKFGPVFDLRTGRSASLDSRLRGLTNYPWTVESGIFAEYWPLEDRLRLRAEIKHGLRPNDGFVADLSADLVEKTGRWTFSVGPRLSLMDRPVARLTFGVSEADAAANSLLPAYRARAGVKSAGVMLAASYDLSKAWTVTAYSRYDRFLDSAAKSPIIHHLGSADQLTFGMGVTYSFKTTLPW